MLLCSKQFKLDYYQRFDFGTQTKTFMDVVCLPMEFAVLVQISWTILVLWDCPVVNLGGVHVSGYFFFFFWYFIDVIVSKVKVVSYCRVYTTGMKSFCCCVTRLFPPTFSAGLMPEIDSTSKYSVYLENKSFIDMFKAYSYKKKLFDVWLLKYMLQ